MVGGDHQQDGPGIRLHGEFGGGGNGGRRVPALRLQDNGGLDAAGACLFGDHEAELGIGDDHRRGEQALAGDAVEHLLEGRQRADQRHELLRHFLARYRPQARTGAAAQNHGGDEGISHENARPLMPKRLSMNKPAYGYGARSLQTFGILSRNHVHASMICRSNPGISAPNRTFAGL
jgi:hypothetical protein